VLLRVCAQVLEKNRRMAYKRGWRRLWDGRGGAFFEKWKVRRERDALFLAQKDQMKGESDVDDDDAKDGRGGMVRVSAYDVAGAYSDPRTRDFPFAPDTDSEDEIDKLERLYRELSSESEFVASDGDDDDDDDDE
jgi:hypothetical protein